MNYKRWQRTHILNPNLTKDMMYYIANIHYMHLSIHKKCFHFSLLFFLLALLIIYSQPPVLKIFLNLLYVRQHTQKNNKNKSYKQIY